MSSRNGILLALSSAVLVAAVIFSVLRILSLTERVNALEDALASRQEAPPLRYDEPVEQRVAPPDGSEHDILSVVDGDTVVIQAEDGSLKVRVIGIDTPETVHPSKPIEFWGPEASERARELLEGKTVTIHYDPDPAHGQWGKYGRLLAYLDLPDGRDFGLVMIQEGHARAYPKYPCSREELYLEAERMARKQGVGMWAKRPTGEEATIKERPCPQRQRQRHARD